MGHRQLEVHRQLVSERCLHPFLSDREEEALLRPKAIHDVPAWLFG